MIRRSPYLKDDTGGRQSEVATAGRNQQKMAENRTPSNAKVRLCEKR